MFCQSKQQTSAPQEQQQQQISWTHTELHPQWNPTSQLCIMLITPCHEFPLIWISGSILDEKKRFNLKKIISCSEFLSQMPDLSSFHYKIQTGYFYNMKNSGLVFFFFFFFLTKEHMISWTNKYCVSLFLITDTFFKVRITGKKNQDKRKRDQVSVEWINSRQVAGWVSWQINTEMKPR